MSAPDAYAPPRPRAPIDLDLSRNEGRLPAGAAPPERGWQGSERYPDTRGVRALLAERFGVAEERVLVTAGGDDALLRVCLATLGEGRRALTTRPTFEMIPRYVAQARGALVEVDWPGGPFPVDAFLEAARPAPAIAFVVSPNNPTGAVASTDDVLRIARALPDTLVVLDAAYGEFAADDPTAAALGLDNVVVVRTLSKAWGLAGARVGCLLGAGEALERVAAYGNPFPISAGSARLAEARLDTGEADMRSYVEACRAERRALAAELALCGVEVSAPSEANFVLARGLDPTWVTAALASLGIAVRGFPDRPGLADAVRITLPGSAPAFHRLRAALEAALRPAALLFDMDGVLADVSESYRGTIVATAKAFGVSLSAADVSAAKEERGANDDWALTRRLLAERGVDVPLSEVTARFERIYQGDGGVAGLRERERSLVPTELLASWKLARRTAVVTGRPRRDAERFLERFQLQGMFDAVIAREDAELKPSPAPVRRALQELGVSSAWMIGDTRDDIEAGRAAGVVPIGVLAPGWTPTRARERLLEAGAAAVLERTEELQELLP